MGISFNINNKGTLEHLSDLGKIPDKLVKEAGDYFHDITPIKTGNARRNTKTINRDIVAEYPYAGRLDDGYSKQAPKGMVEPTIAYIEKRLKQLVEKK